MKKCQTCIWSDWRSGTKIYCPFTRCVKPEKPKMEQTLVDEVQEEKSKVDSEVRG